MFIDTYYALSNFSTTLKEDLKYSDTTVTLSGTENLPEYGWVTVGGSEVIKYTSIIGEILSGINRTNPRDWPKGTQVDQRYNADVINSLIDELK